ncbi:hypothetical protein L195_g043588 [Trifolium pratense]|uniref:Uncharacterized protein n=1 Tax=Trifolium pratense TaxID=57577 RepID=A0A2K3M9Q0_TRIPR|nr:hypothetical protein L195_g043588 [Trifolium pratense]
MFSPSILGGVCDLLIAILARLRECCTFMRTHTCEALFRLFPEVPLLVVEEKTRYVARWYERMFCKVCLACPQFTPVSEIGEEIALGIAKMPSQTRGLFDGI